MTWDIRTSWDIFYSKTDRLNFKKNIYIYSGCFVKWLLKLINSLKYVWKKIRVVSGKLS